MHAVVGLGGSAGRISALQAFFSRMPENSGLTFVVVLHLSPEHESSLAALLQNVTPMRVVTNGGNFSRLNSLVTRAAFRV